MRAGPDSRGIAWGTPASRWALAATVAGSGLAFLDATTVNVALPVLGRELGASVAGLQWTINAYTLTLASLILLAGSMSPDVFLPMSPAAQDSRDRVAARGGRPGGAEVALAGVSMIR